MKRIQQIVISMLVIGLFTFIMQCGGSTKKTKNVEYQIINGDIRVEKKRSQNWKLKGQGRVIVECEIISKDSKSASKEKKYGPCTPEQIEKLTEKEIKAFKKNGYWREYYIKKKITGAGKNDFEFISLLKAEGQYKKNIKVGVWKFYSMKQVKIGSISTPDGDKDLFDYYSFMNKTGEYQDGKKVGLWKMYFEKNRGTGPLFKEIHYKDGKKHGIYKKYDLKGNLKIEMTYVGGKKHGVYKKFEKNKLALTGSYVNDKREGQWIQYFVYDAKMGFFIRDKKGKLIEEKTVSIYKDDKKNGEEITYYGYTDKIKKKGNYVNGEKKGPWTFYQENGKIKMIGAFKPVRVKNKIVGLRWGPWKEYYTNGNLFAEGNRKNKRVGHWKFYRSNGVIAIEGEMANDYVMKRGKIYDKNGKLWGQGKFQISFVMMRQANEKEGTNEDLNSIYRADVPFTYFQYGVNPRTGKIIKGNHKLVIDKDGKAVEYNSAGRPIMKGQVMMGKKQGCWKDLKSSRTLYFMGGREKKGKMAQMMCRGK